jgi:hypothetical protein
MDLDWEELTVAFAARSMLMNHFLDRATGEVHAHLNGSPTCGRRCSMSGPGAI